MTQITNDHGTFEAETEREALRLARAAARKAKRAEAAAQAARDVALDRARSTGYQIHETIAEIRIGERAGFHRGWFLGLPGQTGWPSVKGSALRKGHQARYETSFGSVEADHYGYYVRGVLYNGAGFVIAVALEAVDNAAEAPVLAVGACDGHSAFATLTGVSLADLLTWTEP